jgi:hypothetical protein
MAMKHYSQLFLLRFPNLLALLALTVLASKSGSFATVADDVHNLTGNKEIRVVFTRFARCEGGSDQYYYQRVGWLSQLYYYDSKTDKETQVCPNGDCAEKNYARTLFLSDGKRFVYTIGAEEKVYLTDIAGANPQLVASGLCSCVRNVGGKEWAYVATPENGDTIIYRHNLDNLSEKQKIWDKTGVGGSNPADFLADFFQVAADGKFATDNIPHPRLAIINLETATYDTLRRAGGCNPSIAPDNSYRWFYLGGLHDAVFWFFPTDDDLCVNDYDKMWGDQPRCVRGDQMTMLKSVVGGGTLGQPKYSSNDPRFITFIGPGDYNAQKPIENVNVYLCKLDTATAKQDLVASAKIQHLARCDNRLSGKRFGKTGGRCHQHCRTRPAYFNCLPRAKRIETIHGYKGI